MNSVRSMRSAIILAGGKGVRIGGAKHLRRLSEKPLIHYVIERASTIASEILVVLSKDDDPAAYHGILPSNVKVVVDATQSEAPIVGIMTGARSATSKYSAVLSCDLVFLSSQVLDHLFKQVQGHDAVVPQWPDGHFEALHAVYRTKAAARAAELALEERDYRSIAVAKRLDRVKYLPVDELRRLDSELLTFFNVNNAEDLQRAERLLAERTLS